MLIRRLLLLGITLVTVAVVDPNILAAESQTMSIEGTACMDCHGDKDMSTTFGDGTKLLLHVDKAQLQASAHFSLACLDCHSDFSALSHPKKKFSDRKSHDATYSNKCASCHSSSKNIHQKMLGGSKSLTCISCHGSHQVKTINKNEDSCLGCHRRPLQMTFEDGSSQSLLINESSFKKSVHQKLRCVDCHFGFSSEEHPKRNFTNKRELTMITSESCRRCHFDKYTQTLESIHYNILSKGNNAAPVCADCHGTHAIQSGREEKLFSARKCEKCHPDIYETYLSSVHGDALVSEHNQDVPICSDCHKAHRIVDPRKVDFRNEIPQMCGNCHADKKLMKKYGLSTSVLQSYLEDFHGVTLTFYKKQKESLRHIAVCIDCHGIHNITKTKSPNSTVVKSNLLSRCQKCHPEAKENFPDTWISHYEPTIKRAPLVYAVIVFYKVFIPFMIIGLVLQIFLHIWRYAVNR